MVPERDAECDRMMWARDIGRLHARVNIVPDFEWAEFLFPGWMKSGNVLIVSYGPLLFGFRWKQSGES